MCFIWDTMTGKLYPFRWSILLLKTKAKKAYTALAQVQRPTAALPSVLSGTPLRESRHYVYTDGPDQNSIFWALITSIVF